MSKIYTPEEIHNMSDKKLLEVHEQKRAELADIIAKRQACAAGILYYQTEIKKRGSVFGAQAN